MNKSTFSTAVTSMLDVLPQPHYLLGGSVRLLLVEVSCYAVHLQFRLHLNGTFLMYCYPAEMRV